MFPEAEEALAERLERPGTQMQERKQQLMAAMKEEDSRYDGGGTTPLEGEAAGRSLAMPRSCCGPWPVRSTRNHHRHHGDEGDDDAGSDASLPGGRR
jgi:hypothetical protein